MLQGNRYTFGCWVEEVVRVIGPGAVAGFLGLHVCQVSSCPHCPLPCLSCCLSSCLLQLRLTAGLTALCVLPACALSTVRVPQCGPLAMHSCLRQIVSTLVPFNISWSKTSGQDNKCLQVSCCGLVQRCVDGKTDTLAW